MRLQEEETKANCPDEYNLLSNTVGSHDQPDSIKGLDDTGSDHQKNAKLSPPSIQQQSTFAYNPVSESVTQQEIVGFNDGDLNDRASMNSDRDLPPG